MNNVKNSRVPEEDNDLSYSEEMAQVNAQPELDAEEESYKKRYQDIQRHIQTVRNQKDQELRDVQAQLDAATKKQIKFPKSDAEVDAWASRYPDVAKIVDTIARKRANEALAEGEKRLEQVEKFERSVNRKGAENELLKLHPDFAEIRGDEAFHRWVIKQPIAMQDSVYKNNTDAMWASRTIDLYKSDMSKNKVDRSAAQSVGKTSSAAPRTAGKVSFSESQILSMSTKEFEANEEAIDASRASGTFNYDVTGGAR